MELNVNHQSSDFNSEVVPHLNLLKGYALKITKDYDESEDLLQDTLFKAFKFFQSYKKGSNIKAWLLKIMKNAYINEYRFKARQPLKVSYDDVQNFYESINTQDINSRHYQEDALNNLLSDEVSKALSLLPHDFLTIILLCDVEGYTYKEISEFVDCPIGTVRSRLNRTRKILYSMLYNYAKENGSVSTNNEY